MWFGQVERIGESYVSKKIEKKGGGGKRKRSRPKRKLENSVNNSDILILDFIRQKGLTGDEGQAGRADWKN